MLPNPAAEVESEDRDKVRLGQLMVKNGRLPPSAASLVFAHARSTELLLLRGVELER